MELFARANGNRRKDIDTEPNTENDTEESQVATQAIIEQLNEIPGISVQVVDDVDVPRGAERMAAGVEVRYFTEAYLDNLPKLTIDDTTEYAKISSIINTLGKKRKKDIKKDVLYGAHTANNYYFYTQKEYNEFKIVYSIPLNDKYKSIKNDADETEIFESSKGVDDFVEENWPGQFTFGSYYDYARRGQRRDDGLNRLAIFPKADGRTSDESLGGWLHNVEKDGRWAKALNEDDSFELEKLLAEKVHEAWPNTKVVDKNNLPKIVEHSTNVEDIDSFDYDKISTNSGDRGLYGSGFYFGEQGETGLYGKYTIPFYLNIENPLRIDDYPRDIHSYIVDRFDTPSFRRLVISNGTKECTIGEYIDAVKDVGSLQKMNQHKREKVLITCGNHLFSLFLRHETELSRNKNARTTCRDTITSHRHTSSEDGFPRVRVARRSPQTRI